jgi:hypothetical protein
MSIAVNQEIPRDGKAQSVSLAEFVRMETQTIVGPHCVAPITAMPFKTLICNLISRRISTTFYSRTSSTYTNSGTRGDRPKKRFDFRIHVRTRLRPGAMDHQHHQPIWPLLEGAFHYTMNLASELWMMIWRPVEQSRTQPMSSIAAQSSQTGAARAGGSLHAQKSGEVAPACLAEEREVER